MRRIQATACLVLMLLCANVEVVAEAWEYEIEGSLLYSKPVIRDDLLYIAYRGKKPLRRRYVLCLSATSGKEIWKREHNDDLLSPPLLEEGRLFLPSGLDGVLCLDGRTGKEIWKFKQARSPSGSTFSVGEGRLLVSDRKQWFCLDSASGNELWRLRTGDVRGVSPEQESGKAFLVIRESVSTWKVVAVDAATGTSLWQADLTEGGGRWPSGITLHEESLYVVQHDRTTCVNARNGEILWVANRGAWRKPLIAADSVILWGGELNALDSRTGETKWTIVAPRTQPSYCGVGWVYDPPHIVGEKLLVGHRNGSLFCVTLKTGEVEWRKDFLNRRPETEMVCDGAKIVVFADGQLRGIDIETARHLWDRNLPAGGQRHITAERGRYFISVNGHGVICIEQGDGGEKRPTSKSIRPRGRGG